MAQFLAIVCYRCLVAGLPKDSLDMRVRWFEALDKESVRDLIVSEPTLTYENSDGNAVSWELAEVFAIEPFVPKASGEEVIGFIASTREITELLDDISD